MEKIKLQSQGYAKLDDTTLKLYGLRNCQLQVVHKLRTNLFIIM